jgi:glycine dehydrogenase subunit 2
MKYNPKVNEDIAVLPGFSQSHPLQPEPTTQGALKLMYDLTQQLCEITGMDDYTLQPAAGAHGELTGLMIAKAFFKHQKQEHRTQVIAPDSSHGTNPASASMCGFETVQVKSDSRGGVDLKELEKALGKQTAVLMLTNPNTLGVFDENITRISGMVHQAGGLMYCDGANMNATMGVSRPGDQGFDIIHLNLHKSFSTPHGGGGPGSGPVGVKKQLSPFLPKPIVKKKQDHYFLDYDRPLSIGRVKSFHGNFAVMVKAHAYVTALGANGLREASENAVLNANYLMNLLKKDYELPFDRKCMHEFVLSGKKQAARGVKTLDVAKRLLDYGFHAPTIYFPLIVEEALMIEPTETETRETLDAFAEALKKINEETKSSPEKVRNAPQNTPVSRLDELNAARNPNLKWENKNE